MKKTKTCIFVINTALSHYLANMGREVPEIKTPFVRRWFLEIDPKCYTFLETLFPGVNNFVPVVFRVRIKQVSLKKGENGPLWRKPAIFDPQFFSPVNKFSKKV